MARPWLSFVTVPQWRERLPGPCSGRGVAALGGRSVRSSCSVSRPFCWPWRCAKSSRPYWPSTKPRIMVATDLTHRWSLASALILLQAVSHPVVVYVAATVVVVWVWIAKGMRGRAIWAFITMMVGWVVSEVMKLIVQRVRPALDPPLTLAARICVPVGPRSQHHGGGDRHAPVAVAAAVRRPVARWLSRWRLSSCWPSGWTASFWASISCPTSWPVSSWVVALRSRHGSGSLGRRGRPPPPHRRTRASALRLILGVGFAFAGPLARPLEAEDAINEAWPPAGPPWDAITFLWSYLGSTEVVVGSASWFPAWCSG